VSGGDRGRFLVFASGRRALRLEAPAATLTAIRIRRMLFKI
jgi:hypothetical protein